MDRQAEGERRWRVTSAVLHSEAPSLGETSPDGEVFEPTEVRMELWTDRLEAVSRFTAPEVDVTVWAAGGTLRTLDNLTGYEVVREGGSEMRDYREVTEPLLGFRRAVRRGELRPSGTAADPRPGAYSAASSNLTVDLNAAGLPLRVTTDGATCTFDYSQQLAQTRARTPYRKPETPAERYVYFSAAQVKSHKFPLPDQINGHRRVAVFQRMSSRSPDTKYAVWRSKAGTVVSPHLV